VYVYRLLVTFYEVNNACPEAQTELQIKNKRVPEMDVGYV
jgi:hypothetical protein